jgi:hypothetical protein
MSMVASHLVWLWRTKEMRKRAKEEGQTFDEHEECLQWQAKGLDLEGMFGRLFSKKDQPYETSDHGGDGAGALVEPHSVVPKTVPNAMV